MAEPTNHQCLLRISGYQSWLKVHETQMKKGGGDYGPGFFRNKVPNFQKTLENPGRQSIMRLIARGKCYVPDCEKPITFTSEFDHLIPRINGGSKGVENTFPLCKNHNSSKGRKDLIEWWMEKGFDVNAFEHDGLLHYSRMTYRFDEANGTLDQPAPQYLIDFTTRLALNLPTQRHRETFFEIGRIREPSLGEFIVKE